MLSQNGYSANDSGMIATYTVAGTSQRLPLRKGYTSAVLLWVAAMFNAQVEHLVVGWCWGYAYRSIRGTSTTLSNHASGTAIDLNAPRHPLGTSPTSNYSAAKIAKIHDIVRYCEGAVRWGGDYTTRKDGMHFEINAPYSVVTRIALKIARATKVPAAPAPGTSDGGPSGGFPLRPGHYYGVNDGRAYSHSGYSSSDRYAVSAIQREIGARADGQFGRVTQGAVMNWQRRYGLSADGKVGPSTWASMTRN